MIIATSEYRERADTHITRVPAAWLSVFLHDGEKLLSHREKTRFVTVCRFETRPGAEPDQSALRAACRGATGSTLTSPGVLVIVDLSDKTLSISADPLGLQPVYFRSTPSDVIASTRLDDLLEENHGIAQDALSVYLRLQYIPPPLTIYEGIHRLEPGARLEIRFPNEPKSRLKPTLEMIRSPPQIPMDDQCDAEGVTRLLTRSIRRQIVDVNHPISMLLSAGLDSGSNAALFVRLGIPVSAFTAGFAEEAFDESKEARDAARFFGLQHEIVRVDDGCMSHLDEMAAALDQPLGDRAFAAQWVLGRRIRERGFDVVATGEGGDEILGYPRNLRLKSMAPAEETFDSYFCGIQLAPADLVGRLLGTRSDPARPLLKKLFARERGTPFARVHALQWRTWMVANTMAKDVAAFAGQGLKVVHPFMDYALTQQMRTARQLETLVSDKALLRAATGHLLPERALSRTKTKFHLPMAYWMRNQWAKTVADRLLDPDGPLIDIVDLRVLDGLIRQHMSGSDLNRLLWATLILDAWLRGRSPQRT